MKKISRSFSVKGFYTLIFAIVGTIVLIWDFIDYLFFHSYLAKYDLLYTDKGTIFISFFTQQTNIIVIIYFYFVAYFHFTYQKLDIHSFLIRLFVTVYITVTSIVFTAGLLPGIVNKTTYDLKGWIFTAFLHFIIPIGMLIYFFWMSGKFHYDLRRFNRQSLYKVYIYPFFYFLFIMVRGELRHQNSFIDSLYEKFPLESFDLEYPYWFLNYHHYTYGIATITVTFLFIFILITGLTYLFISLNNVIFEKRQYRHSKMVRR